MTRHVPTLALSLCTLALALVTTGCETVGWEIDDGFDGAERVFAAPGTYTLTLDSPGCRYGMLDLACENHSTELPADAAIEASIDDPAIASLAGPPSREVSWDPYTLPLIIHQPGRFALTVRDRDSGYQQTFDLEARGVDRIELEHPGAVALEGATLCVKGDLVGAEGEVLHSRLAWTLHADSDWPQSIDPDPSRPRQQSCLPELPAGQYWFSATYDGVVAEQMLHDRIDCRIQAQLLKDRVVIHQIGAHVVIDDVFRLLARMQFAHGHGSVDDGRQCLQLVLSQDIGDDGDTELIEFGEVGFQVFCRAVWERSYRHSIPQPSESTTVIEA